MMTLENCKRLLKHFEGVAARDGRPTSIAQAKLQIIAFKERIRRKESPIFLEKIAKRDGMLPQNTILKEPVIPSGKKPKR